MRSVSGRGGGVGCAGKAHRLVVHVQLLFSPTPGIARFELQRLEDCFGRAQLSARFFLVWVSIYLGLKGVHR